MKKINILIILFCIYSKVVFADINSVFYMDIYDRNLSIDTNTSINKNEFFIEQSALGGFNYIKFNLETKLYYRLYFYKNATNFLFKNTKVDFGIENNFSLSSDLIGAFIDIRPLSFLGIRISAYADFMFNIMNFGYAGFDSSKVNYSFDDLYNMNKGNAFGFLVNISPYFLFKFDNFVLINNLNMSYVNVGNKEYYYDPRTSILHKKSEFELINDFFILGKVSSFYIGGYYGLTYLLNSRHLSHKIGIIGLLNFKFLKDSLILNIGVSAGLHLKLPYYNNKTYIETKISLAYKIF